VPELSNKYLAWFKSLTSVQLDPSQDSTFATLTVGEDVVYPPTSRAASALSPAPAVPSLAVLIFAPDAQAPAPKSVIVSLKAFAVELKNNCPSTCFVNVAGAVHSSVAAEYPGSIPPAAIASLLVPFPAICCPLAVPMSPISVQLDPSQNSVLAVTGVVPPPYIITSVLLDPG